MTWAWEAPAASFTGGGIGDLHALCAVRCSHGRLAACLQKSPPPPPAPRGSSTLCRAAAPPPPYSPPSPSAHPPVKTPTQPTQWPHPHRHLLTAACPRSIADDHYFLIDCPGQVELFTVAGSLKAVLAHLADKLHHRLVAVQLVDAHLCTDASKWVGGWLGVGRHLLLLLLLCGAAAGAATSADPAAAAHRTANTSRVHPCAAAATPLQPPSPFAPPPPLETAATVAAGLCRGTCGTAVRPSGTSARCCCH